MKLDRIYTRGGDDGTTSLGDGARVSKFDPRVEAYGTLDEANACLGLALLHVVDADARETLRLVQNDFFDLGADLCRPEGDNSKSQPLRVTEHQVTWLEQRIDRFNDALEPLTSFVLPGGSPASAFLHQARTVVRRAERLTVALAAEAAVNPQVVKYLNRLSDLLFVLGRYENDGGRADVLWIPGLNR